MNSAMFTFVHFIVVVCACLSPLVFLRGAFEEVNHMETTEASVFPVKKNKKQANHQVFKLLLSW